MFADRLRRSRRLAVLLAAACAVATFSFLGVFAPPIANSPDEAANAYFAEQFAERWSLRAPAPHAALAGELAHPRSMRIDGGSLVPGGFIGMPVLLGLARKIAPFLAWLLTPLLAVAAATAWGSLVAGSFGRRAGYAAGALLLLHPAWWYWASRPFMPNVAFLSLLIIAAWAFFRQPLAQRGLPAWTDGAAAGALAATGLAIRPAELYWLLPAALLLALWHRRALPAARIAAAIGAGLLTLAPFFLINHATYGAWLGLGYGGGSLEALGVSLPRGLGDRLLGSLRPYLFPLGFAPRASLQHFWTYGLEFFWWWTALAAGACLALLARARRSAHAVVAGPAASWLLVGAASLYLIPLYGSWTLSENIQGVAAIGSSYLRYWLPLFCLSTVPVAVAVAGLSERLPEKLRRSAAAAGFACLALVSGVAVFASPGEGLLAIRQTLRGYAEIRRSIFASTEQNALIVTDRSDKYLFPGRAVAQPLRSEHIYGLIGRSASQVPVYYFGVTLPESDLGYLQRVKLAPYGLRLLPIRAFGNETLYRIVGAGSAAGVAAR